MLVEFGVSKLSVAFVDVPSLVHNNSTGTFVRGFYNYVLSLFKLIYGLSFCNSKVILSRFCLVVVMSSLTASKKVLRALSLSLGGGGGGGSKYSCYGKDCRVRWLCDYCCFRQKSTRLIACAEKSRKCRLKLPAS